MLVISDFLEDYLLFLAYDGIEALSVLDKHPDIDLMILDLNMPNMNGFSVLKYLQDNPRFSHLITLVLTTSDEPENEIRGLELGAVDYITKPYEVLSVKARVNTQLKLKLQRDQLEMQKKELERINQELESFSYSVSHDLKAPLNLIKLYSGFLEKSLRLTGDDQSLSDIAVIDEACDHMYKLIESILLLTKVGLTEFNCEPINLSTIAQQIIKKLRMSNPERQVQFICEPNLQAEADSTLIEIVLFNLLHNAWKYTSQHVQAVIEFGTFNDNGQLTYFVKDDGAGFDMNHAADLFNQIKRMHTSAEFEGTGVGLTIVNRIIKRHKGRIWATSEVEQGSTFFFTLGHI
jgi:light-regulated signal transduction histidine kinase (bacteriophytochrome)